MLSNDKAVRLATGGGKERKKKREKNGSTDLPQIIWNYTFRTKNMYHYMLGMRKCSFVYMDQNIMSRNVSETAAIRQFSMIVNHSGMDGIVVSLLFPS